MQIGQRRKVKGVAGENSASWSLVVTPSITSYVSVSPQAMQSLSSAVEKIKMSCTDENGNEVSMTVTEYYEAMMGGAIPFAEMEQYPFNLAAYFVKSLSSQESQ